MSVDMLYLLPFNVGGQRAFLHGCIRVAACNIVRPCWRVHGNAQRKAFGWLAKD
jgi:hypothetical protein